jgi:hypothetical protein
MPNCSFCKQPGHNINKCESPNIIPLVETLCQQVDSNNYAQLYYYLVSINVKDTKMLSIQLGFKATNTRKKHIYQIMNRYYSNIPRAPWNTVPPAVRCPEVMRTIMAYINERIALRQAEVDEEDKTAVFVHLDKTQETTTNECVICLEENVPCQLITKLGCNHEFCMNCVVNIFKSNTLQNTCSMCRTPIKKICVNTKLIQYQLFNHLENL